MCTEIASLAAQIGRRYSFLCDAELGSKPRLAIEFLVLVAGVIPTPGETHAQSFASTGHKEGNV
jgi:hypothetical protein